MIALCFLFAAPVFAAPQLPPEILLDQLLLRAERLVDEDDLDAAVVAMDEAFALGAEHGLELPPGQRFEHARVSFAVGLLEGAKASVTEYLTAAGREGESYEDALALLEGVDGILERRDAPECSPRPEGAACWMELTSHPGCYVWNPNPQPDETATWTGDCSAGFAQGPGTVVWKFRDSESESEVNLRHGRAHGDAVYRFSAPEEVHEGPVRFGRQHGRWVQRLADGTVHEGPVVDGERNGHWVFRYADGAVHEGPYVDGEQNGHWVLRFTNRQVESGPYVDNERNGHWIIKNSDGTVDEGPYLDGKQNGHWVLRYASGAVHEGPVVGRGSETATGSSRTRDGTVDEGPYLDGKRNGHWVLRFTDGRVENGPYVDGEQHGRWTVRPPDGETFYVTMVRGVRQEP